MSHIQIQTMNNIVVINNSIIAARRAKERKEKCYKLFDMYVSKDSTDEQKLEYSECVDHYIEYPDEDHTFAICFFSIIILLVLFGLYKVITV